MSICVQEEMRWIWIIALLLLLFLIIGIVIWAVCFGSKKSNHHNLKSWKSNHQSSLQHMPVKEKGLPVQSIQLPTQLPIQLHHSPAFQTKSPIVTTDTSVPTDTNVPADTNDKCNWETIDKETKACYLAAGNDRNKRRDCVAEYYIAVQACGNNLITPALKKQSQVHKKERQRPPVSYERLRSLLSQRPHLQQQLSQIYQSYCNCYSRMGDSPSCINTFAADINDWTKNVNTWEFDELEKYIQLNLNHSFLTILFEKLLLRQE